MKKTDQFKCVMDECDEYSILLESGICQQCPANNMKLDKYRCEEMQCDENQILLSNGFC